MGTSNHLFFRTAQPPTKEQPYQPITHHQWIRALKRKKPRAAQGPDGWSRKDLLSLQGDLTDAILQVLHKVEMGEMQWPRHWLVGIIHSTALYHCVFFDLL